MCTYYQIEPLVRAYSIFSESYLKIDTVVLERGTQRDTHQERASERESVCVFVCDRERESARARAREGE